MDTVLPASFYAGVGSRATPPEVLAIMARAASALESRGYVLRSGGAAGADSAFESGVRNPANTEIYLPWKGFRGHPSARSRPSVAAVHLGARYHPALRELQPADIDSASGRLRGLLMLMGRNVHQVLGDDLDNRDAYSRFVLCFTADGADGVALKTSGLTGGTGQAIRIAADFGVPVFNLQRDDHRERVLSMIAAECTLDDATQAGPH